MTTETEYRNKYKERDLIALDQANNHYSRHVFAMTKEDLRSKSDIAAELGYRDFVIELLESRTAYLVEAIQIMIDDSIDEVVRDKKLIANLEKAQLFHSKFDDDIKNLTSNFGFDFKSY